MSFTKVAPAGIGTEPGNSILIGDSLLHSTGIDIGSNTGIGVTIRKHGDATFTGIITASAFFGDGSGLEGVSSSGIGTALSDDDTSELNKVYYVNQELSIGSTVTVNHPDSAVASYTHYQDLVVKDNADFIVADGDTFIPDVLGINTSSLPNPVSGATGGRIRAGTITNAGANGAVNFPNGLVATSATFTGVLTYEDVTNVDSIGIITARGGIRIGGGTTVGPSSGIITYFGDGSQLTGISADSTKIETGNTKVETVDTGSDGHVKITTEGSERLRIQSDGDVGIGTIDNTNNERLRIQDDASTSTVCQVSIISGSAERSVLNFGDKEDPNIGRVSYHNNTNTISLFTNNTERLLIDSSGNVTKPTNFHLIADRTSNQTGYNASNMSDVIIWNRVVSGQSSTGASNHFDTSTGLFTAPVTGLYLFHVAVNCSYAVQGAWLNINGSRPNFANFYPNGAQSADAMITYKVTAGQTVGVKWYYNGQTNGTINSNALHTWWRIILLG